MHQRFSTAHVEAFRAQHPDGIVIAHPECSHEVCSVADQVGSTDFIIRAVEAAPEGSTIAIGTEIHLVDRLAAETPGKTIVSLDPLICPCSTMFRIDGPHLAWVLENLVEGRVINQITVDPETTEWAKVALQRMLDITQGNPVDEARPGHRLPSPPGLTYSIGVAGGSGRRQPMAPAVLSSAARSPGSASSVAPGSPGAGHARARWRRASATVTA